MTITRCMRCKVLWSHNAGPREHFTVITRACPLCIPQLYPAVGR